MIPKVAWWCCYLMEQHCRDGSTYSEGNSKADLLEISHWESDELDYLFYSWRRRNWSYAFIHASKSSKCILFSIWGLIQLCPLSQSRYPWPTEWIVNEVIDWLKVCNPAVIKEIFCTHDIREEPDSRSSTAGSADRLGGRCKQENRKGNSDSGAEGY